MRIFYFSINIAKMFIFETSAYFVCKGVSIKNESLISNIFDAYAKYFHNLYLRINVDIFYRQKFIFVLTLIKRRCYFLHISIQDCREFSSLYIFLFLSVTHTQIKQKGDNVAKFHCSMWNCVCDFFTQLESVPKNLFKYDNHFKLLEY